MGILSEMDNGLKINHRGSVDTGIIEEVFSLDLYKVGQIPKHSVVIDIGANIGTFSLRCAYERDCMVYSYEACEDNYKLLVDNININKLNNKIKAFHKAVSNVNGVRDFYIDPNHYGGSSFFLKYQADRKAFKGIYHTVKVDCITLKKIFDDNNIEHCSTLKLDCEGEEKHILLDDDTTIIIDKIDNIVMEYHCLSYGKLLEHYLKNNGFATQNINPSQSEIGYLYANRN
jgi:FkbM family methyltransferase